MKVETYFLIGAFIVGWIANTIAAGFAMSHMPKPWYASAIVALGVALMAAGVIIETRTR